MCGLTQLMIYLSIFHMMKVSGIQNVDPLGVCVGGLLVGHVHVHVLAIHKPMRA